MPPPCREPGPLPQAEPSVGKRPPQPRQLRETETAHTPTAVPSLPSEPCWAALCVGSRAPSDSPSLSRPGQGPRAAQPTRCEN